MNWSGNLVPVREKWRFSPLLPPAHCGRPGGVTTLLFPTSENIRFSLLNPGNNLSCFQVENQIHSLSLNSSEIGPRAKTARPPYLSTVSLWSYLKCCKLWPNLIIPSPPPACPRYNWYQTQVLLSPLVQVHCVILWQNILTVAPLSTSTDNIRAAQGPPAFQIS